jgi:hypothetical protein
MVTLTSLTKFSLPAVSRQSRRLAPRFQSLLDILTTREWIWKTPIAGLCGSITHTVLMLGKVELGILESFQPYHSLQLALGNWTGQHIHPLLPWLISYVNGSTAAGFAFAKVYRLLPGTGGLVKGLIAGVFGWLVMDLLFFPVLGMGPFASSLKIGPGPAFFSLAMMLTYTVIMGGVYSLMDSVSLSEGL